MSVEIKDKEYDPLRSASVAAALGLLLDNLEADEIGGMRASKESVIDRLYGHVLLEGTLRGLDKVRHVVSLLQDES